MHVHLKELDTLALAKIMLDVNLNPEGRIYAHEKSHQ